MEKRITSLDAYQLATRRTENTDMPIDKRILNDALGIAGEAGEIADDIKKWYFHGHHDALKKASEEIGDILWYIARLADNLNLPLSKAVADNISKLRERYPEGFSSADSIARVDHDKG